MTLDITNWWAALSNSAQIFCAIGIVSNLFFVLYLIVQSLGHDTDLDTHTDFHDGNTLFAVLSVRSILAFGMFLGYAGFATLQTGFGLIPALIIGVIAGFLAAWLAVKLVQLMLRLQSSGTMDLRNAVGVTGTVHLTLSANAATTGKVMVVIQGALREMDAVSEGETIPNGTPILVTEVLENGQLVVVPYAD